MLYQGGKYYDGQVFPKSPQKLKGKGYIEPHHKNLVAVTKEPNSNYQATEIDYSV